MSRRFIALIALLTAIAGCTSARPTPVGTTFAPVMRTPDLTGLTPVRGYAQEFCRGNAVPLTCPNGAIPTSLRRPLEIPAIRADASCPVTAPNPRIWTRTAPGLGPGPVAPIGLGERSTLKVRGFPGSAWSGQKVLWVAAPEYDGPVLIRGARLDADGAVGFNVNGGGPPLRELQLPPGSEPASFNRGGYRAWPSYTRVRAPGCYGYQVDGSDFSYVIVFAVEHDPG